MADPKEDLLVSYITGTVRVPNDLWAIVKKYRQLESRVETQGEDHVEDMNKLYDALEVLVEGRES